jgi:hypothetical protein
MRSRLRYSVPPRRNDRSVISDALSGSNKPTYPQDQFSRVPFNQYFLQESHAPTKEVAGLRHAVAVRRVELLLHALDERDAAVVARRLRLLYRRALHHGRSLPSFSLALALALARMVRLFAREKSSPRTISATYHPSTNQNTCTPNFSQSTTTLRFNMGAQFNFQFTFNSLLN